MRDKPASMKKPIRNALCLALTVLVLNIIAPLANAQQPLNQNVNGMAGTYNFAPISAVKPTEYVNLMNAVMSNHTVEVNVTTAPSVCTFLLEGSNSGLAWFGLTGSAASCTTSAMFTYTGQPVRFVRVRIVTFTGTAPVSFYYTGTR